MKLADVLPEARVRIEERRLSKPELLRSLAALFLDDRGGLSVDDGDSRPVEEAFRALWDREILASTGVGSGVAIPHGRFAGVSEMRAALIVCPGGIDFSAIDGEPVRIVLGILAPDRHTSDHLKALARVSRLLRDSSVRERIVALRDVPLIHQYVIAEDSRH